MAHRVDPNRGVFHVDCDLCGHTGDCRLTQVNDRYLWVCVAGCPAEAS